jgi:hypothetical protein
LDGCEGDAKCRGKDTPAEYARDMMIKIISTSIFLVLSRVSGARYTGIVLIIHAIGQSLHLISPVSKDAPPPSFLDLGLTQDPPLRAAG